MRIANYIDFYRIVINKKIFLDTNDITRFKYKKDTLSLRPYISDIQKMQENNKLKQSIKTQEIKIEKKSSKTKKKINKLIKGLKSFFIDMLKKLNNYKYILERLK